MEVKSNTIVVRRPKARQRRGKRKDEFNRNIEFSRLFNMTGEPPRPLASRPNVPFNLSQTACTTAAITSSTTVPVLYATYFAVSAIDQISSLAAVFDQYRILTIEWWTQPRNSESFGAGVNPGIFATAVDYDDANSPAAAPEIYDYENALIGNGTSVHYHRWHPHAATAMYAGAFTSYGNVTSPWIDMASTTVQHYGIKASWTPTDVAFVMDVVVRYHVQFRNVR